MTEAGRSPSRAERPRTARLLIVVAAVALPSAAPADPPLAASTTVPARFVMSADAGVPLSAYFKRAYTEAFRRLGVPLEFAEHSLPRRNALAEEGTIDGDIARVREYGDAHPRLIRVEEPIYDFSFALFSARPEVRLARLDDLVGARWSVEYRRGILMCQKELEPRVPKERLSDVAATEQGVRKLIAGRVDLYCDLDEGYVQEALRQPEFRGNTGVHRVLRFATLPTYAYVGARHAALARRLAEVLRQMRAEGLLDRYLREARGERGGD